MSGNPPDIPYGGACAWRLPPDATCARQARSVLADALAVLQLSSDLIHDAVSAVSELAGNAYQHATCGTNTCPELWIWSRTKPRPELVISVYDACPGTVPRQGPTGTLAESGRGLGIVSALSSAWGWRPTRSRLNRPQISGKATWFALPLPHTWPPFQQPIHPAVAAQRLLLALHARGIKATRHSDPHGVSVILTETLNIWVDRNHFYWGSTHNRKASPLIDLQETTELVVQRIEETRSLPTA